MATSLQVANHLLLLAKKEIEPEFPTHLQLQKLLYYVQGWTLALSGKVIFEAEIQAWQHGPVVRDLYNVFNAFGRNPIVDYSPSDEDLDPVSRFHTVLVWEYYKRFSASALRRKTHNERPWIEARKGLKPEDKCANVISVDSMKEFFANESKDRKHLQLRMLEVPTWAASDDTGFIDIAQRIFVKRDAVLNRLAQ
jgi:uncharacterized phage-associated protein